MTATASDNVGVQNVQFRVDGNNVGSADTTSPYSVDVNTTTLTNGSHTLSAVARDAAGNTRTSANVTVTVDNSLPNVSVTAPAAGALVSGTMSVTATASDNVGVQSVQFRVDGNNVGSADTSSPYSLSLDTNTLTNGTHTLSAVARDAAGNTRTSAERDDHRGQLAADGRDHRAGERRHAVRHHHDDRHAPPTTWRCRAWPSRWTAPRSPRTRARPTRSPARPAGSPTATTRSPRWPRDTAGNTRTSAAVAVKVDNNAPDGLDQLAQRRRDRVGHAHRHRERRRRGRRAERAVPRGRRQRGLGRHHAARTRSPGTRPALTDGEHTLSAVARDAVGNTRTSANVTVTVDNDGLVAAFGFEETSGSTATDVVRDHDGTISGATRTTSGRFGRALAVRRQPTTG